ncbi:MAG: response regulator [Chloroflexi bacterium]|nr:response regulator [Chloroflexota bacterium]
MATLCYFFSYRSQVWLYSEKKMDDKQKLILVVEDESDTADMFAEMLNLVGFRVVTSHASTSAFELLESEKPDAVLLDVMMPEISGLEVLREIRKNSTLKDIPVIVVTAKSLPSDIKDGFEAGATEYLSKPVSYLDLKKALEDSFQAAQNKSDNE